MQTLLLIPAIALSLMVPAMRLTLIAFLLSHFAYGFVRHVRDIRRETSANRSAALRSVLKMYLEDSNAMHGTYATAMAVLGLTALHVTATHPPLVTEEAATFSRFLTALLILGIPVVLYRRIFSVSFERVVLSGVAYFLYSSLLLLAVRLWGDGVMGAWHASPKAVVLLALSVTAVSWVMTRALATADWALWRGSTNPHADLPVGVAMRTNFKLSVRDRQVMAAHEAGHALMWATRPEREAPSITMSSEGTTRGAYAYVSHERSNHLMSFAETHFEMLVLVAGSVAEEVLLGESFCGSSGDMRDYIKLAQQSAGNWDVDKRLIIGPSSVSAEQHNQHVIREMMDEHRAAAREFLEANRTVLAELAAELQGRARMDADDLIPYLRRAKLTGGLSVHEDACGQR